MWITIYFKSGKIVETLIKYFSEIDKYYDKEDILRIDMGCTMLDNKKVD